MTNSGLDGGSRPGWYPNPDDPRQLRYWDGWGWTVHIAPGQLAATSVRRTVRWWQSWWVVVPGLVLCMPLGLIGLWLRPGVSTRVRVGFTAACVVLIGAVALAPSDDDSPAEHDTTSAAKASPTPSAPTATVTVTEEATPSTEPAVEPTEDAVPVVIEPPRAVVPLVEGMTRKQAAEALTAAGLTVREFRPVPSDHARGTILRQGKDEGTSVRAGSSVVLIVAAPYPLVPSVIGLARAAAVSRLESAGFKVAITEVTRTSGAEGTVLGQTPGGSERAEPGSTIAVFVSHMVRPLAPTVSQNCTPGYKPCLTPASDYDCAGGSGNGPAYAEGPIYVTGSDPYDLDSEGDGIACES
jgi:hypothetical protein